MTTVKVRNTSSVPLLVDIRNKRTQEVTQVNIQPKGGVTLPRDYVVDQNYYVRNKSALRILTRD